MPASFLNLHLACLLHLISSITDAQLSQAAAAPLLSWAMSGGPFNLQDTQCCSCTWELRLPAPWTGLLQQNLTLWNQDGIVEAG